MIPSQCTHAFCATTNILAMSVTLAVVANPEQSLHRVKGVALRSTKCFGYLLQVVYGGDIDNLVDLGRVAEKLLCAGVQHPELAVAGNRKVEYQDVRNCQPTGRLHVYLSTTERLWKLPRAHLGTGQNKEKGPGGGDEESLTSVMG